MKLLTAMLTMGLLATGTAHATGPGAALGAFCGGFAGIRCQDGLTCKLAGGFADAGGRCERAVPAPTRPTVPTPTTPTQVKRGGTLGGFCGGFAGIACGKGLSCKLAGRFPDAGGKCVR